jgi:hypothetical protein
VNALDRADQALARAQARRAGVVTPDSATSPMDQASTVQIPRTLVQAADPRAADPESTLVIPAAAGDPRAGMRSGFGPARQHH